MPEPELERLAAALPPPRDLATALRPAGLPPARSGRLAVIAEMKARTPIMGELSREYVPAHLASRYARAGAAALSVLCQETSFGGRPEHLAEARAATGLPVLRKDFVVTEHQVLEGRVYGADAVLLIVAALEAGRLRELLALTRRDLTSFEVDLGLTERLRPLVPAEVVLVAESGIRDAADARRVREAGADAILVGEALMRATDPEAKLEELAAA